MHPEHEDTFELRSLNFLGVEHELRAAALADLEAVGGKSYRAPLFEEAGDSTNSVRVAVTANGTVVNAHFRADWRSELMPQNLGPALLEAYQNATSAMMDALALASLAEEERRAAGEDEEPQVLDPLPDAPKPSITQIWQMLSDVEDMMYRADRHSRRSGGDSVRTIYSSLWLFKGMCDGRRIASISADLMLVQDAEPEQLRWAALDLFRQAEEVSGKDDL